MLFKRLLLLTVISLLPHWVCLALYSSPAMNLLPRSLRKLSKSSLEIECLGGQYTTDVVIGSCQSSIATFYFTSERVNLSTMIVSNDSKLLICSVCFAINFSSLSKLSVFCEQGTLFCERSL